MGERKEKLLEQKRKIEDKIKAEQGKIKIINQELENIEVKEKLNSAELLMDVLKSQGIENIDVLVELAKQGKIEVKRGEL